MFKAICIKSYKGIRKGELINAWYGFNDNIYYFRGFKIYLNMTQKEFDQYFMPFNNYYIVQKPDVKRRFRKPKKEYMRVEFKHIPQPLLVELYNCVFSYIELARQIDPGLIQTFSYSIITTLEKLEHLYTVLPGDKFLEAIRSAEQVFKGMYKTALSIDIELLPKSEDYEQLLKQFKEDAEIVGGFFKELNK